MVRKRKKWTRRILSLMLAATLSISAFSGFYRPAYAEESIVQEVSTEDLPTNETEATEDSSEDSEVVRDEQLINPVTTEDVTEAVAESFINSAEFKNKKLNDEEYVKVLYRTFMGREADASGLEHWKNELKRGCTREEILHRFATSKEFRNIQASFGL